MELYRDPNSQKGVKATQTGQVETPKFHISFKIFIETTTKNGYIRASRHRRNVRRCPTYGQTTGKKGKHFQHVHNSISSAQTFYQVLSFGMIVSSALMIWKGLMVVTGSESPIVVVLSGSMEPAFHRGDLLFLTNIPTEPVRVGEIVVFKVEGRDIPIVHRVIKLHEKESGEVIFLTKGDNNSVDDRGLYAPGQLWLSKKDIVGRARGFLPYVGMITIYMNEYPNFKYAILGVLAVYVLLHRE